VGLASPVIEKVRSRRCLLPAAGLDVVASPRRDLLRPGSTVPIARLAVDCRGTQCVRQNLIDVPRVPRNDKEVGTIDDAAVCRPYGALVLGGSLATELTPLRGWGHRGD
jgi:hypothetical protein